MTPRSRSLVAASLLAMVAYACGDTTRNSEGSDTPDTTSTTTASGGSTTNSVTSGETSSSTGGTGGTTPNTCPSFEPAEGSGCTAEGQVCDFENCQAPDYRDDHTLTCVGGAWQLTLATACPFDSCPTVPPLLGHGCDASVTPGPCVAVNPCGEGYQAVCLYGTWQMTDDQDSDRPGTDGGGGGVGTSTGGAEAPFCPAYPPYLGDPCCPAFVPERCDYTDPGTTGAAGASFLIQPDPSGSGGTAAPPPVLDCAMCTDQMYWDSCPLE